MRGNTQIGQQSRFAGHCVAGRGLPSNEAHSTFECIPCRCASARFPWWPTGCSLVQGAMPYSWSIWRSLEMAGIALDHPAGSRSGRWTNALSYHKTALLGGRGHHSLYLGPYPGRLPRSVSSGIAMAGAIFRFIE